MRARGAACSRVMSFAAIVVVASLARADGPAPPAEQAAAEIAAGPARASVVFRGEKLFTVGPIGSLSPEARAGAISDRLSRLAAGPASALAALHIDEQPHAADLYVGDQIVMSVSDADALPTGRTRAQLAVDDQLIVYQALVTEFRGRSLRGLLLGSAYALAATVALVLLLWVWRRSGRRFHAWLGAWALGHLPVLRLQRAEILSRERGADLVVHASRLVWSGLVLAGLYLYLATVLNFFPWTRGLGERLFGAVLGALRWVALGVLGYLPNLLYIALIILVTRAALRLTRVVFDEIARGTIAVPGFYADWALPTFKIVRFLILALSMVIVFPYLPGSSSPAFQGVSVFLGVLLSFGSATAVGNIVAGVVLTYMRPFQIGDRVRIADTVGDILDKNLLVVRVRTIKNVDVTVPSAMVLANHIVNYSSCARDKGLILHTEVTIGYDAPWRQVHALLIAAAGATDGILADPAPFVMQTALDDFYVHYEINGYTDRPNEMAGTYARLRANIQDRFNEAGLEIMSPHFTAARDGNRIAIPDPHLPRGYRAPAFRVLRVDEEGGSGGGDTKK